MPHNSTTTVNPEPVPDGVAFLAACGCSNMTGGHDPLCEYSQQSRDGDRRMFADELDEGGGPEKPTAKESAGFAAIMEHQAAETRRLTDRYAAHAGARDAAAGQ